MSITTVASAAAATATSVTATAESAGGVSGIGTTISGISVDFAIGGLIATVLLLAMLVIREFISTRSGRSISEMARAIGVGIVSLVPLFGVIVSLRVLSAL